MRQNIVNLPGIDPPTQGFLPELLTGGGVGVTRFGGVGLGAVIWCRP